MNAFTIDSGGELIDFEGRVSIRKIKNPHNKRLECPDCHWPMEKMIIDINDLPLFIGWGSCKCDISVD